MKVNDIIAIYNNIKEDKENIFEKEAEENYILGIILNNIMLSKIYEELALKNRNNEFERYNTFILVIQKDFENL